MNKFATGTAVAAILSLTGPVFAQDQEGLVNLSVDDNVVQVPVSVAANVCDISVNVLSSDFVGSENTACSIDEDTAAANGISGFEGDDDAEDAERGNGNGTQNGLVNVSVDGNTVQVPIGVAANVCDVDANVLARDFKGSDEDVCTISQETAAENNLPNMMEEDEMEEETEEAEELEEAENEAEEAEEEAEELEEEND